ncbi:uncharacterized protein LOC119250163 [Talpa occidentalis]|uniref:uncharacterized protein LOC119250163 n=1 Tax=Talpa occidentalis TaxID=50954 RepID=UPI0023F92A98|nr:uncharacterized protein LOC119250163 [Talpa occidentalis]
MAPRSKKKAPNGCTHARLGLLQTVPVPASPRGVWDPPPPPPPPPPSSESNNSSSQTIQKRPGPGGRPLRPPLVALLLPSPPPSACQRGAISFRIRALGPRPRTRAQAGGDRPGGASPSRSDCDSSSSSSNSSSFYAVGDTSSRPNTCLIMFFGTLLKKLINGRKRPGRRRGEKNESEQSKYKEESKRGNAECGDKGGRVLKQESKTNREKERMRLDIVNKIKMPVCSDLPYQNQSFDSILETFLTSFLLWQITQTSDTIESLQEEVALLAGRKFCFSH